MFSDFCVFRGHLYFIPKRRGTTLKDGGTILERGEVFNKSSKTIPKRAEMILKDAETILKRGDVFNISSKTTFPCSLFTIHFPKMTYLHSIFDIRNSISPCEKQGFVLQSGRILTNSSQNKRIFPMAYESIDKLQKVLQDDVFHYAKDSKKAAGRALGTIVEIITFYLLKAWGLNDSISIERGLAEYGNPEITHNVEYSLHPVLSNYLIKFPNNGRSITSNAVVNVLKKSDLIAESFVVKKSINLLSKDRTLRNACTFAKNDQSYLLCSFDSETNDEYSLRVYEQLHKPYAIFECKRVGVEDGMKKGPQTIEKAKQGAYVARTVSSLQKIRNENGDMLGIIYKSDGSLISKPFTELMEEVIASDDAELLRRFVLTVGVVSNHGNWFTSTNQNKEMKVLAQSYDWLLFLTDGGLAQFIETLLLNPIVQNEVIKEAFHLSYSADKKKNTFTKVQMNLLADKMLLNYFRDNLSEIESWFEVISPGGKSIETLKAELQELKNKNWTEILV